ncbi:MAG TPA: DUF560 domain-containing protein [Rhizobiales bacterium]|nr:DUF560 domain-containing protein [Hyphomicrobiales bacterium]
MPENIRLRIMLKMIKSGAHDRADYLLKTTPFTGPLSANRTLFLEGLIAKMRKQYDVAIKKFRTVLASDPKLTMVRAELAHTLFITEQDDSAKFQLKLLSGAAPTPELAKKFDRFIDAVDARRPWKVSGYLSMAPSTNFTYGTTRRLTPGGGVIAGNSRKKSGIGITGGANAGYTFKPGNDLSVVVAAGVNFRDYKGETFDDLIVSQDVSVVRKHKSGQIAIGVTVSERKAGPTEFILEGGPYIAITQKISNKVQFFIKLRHLRTDFKQSDYRNGSTTTIDNRLTNAISQDSVFYLLSGAQRTTTTLKHLNFWAAYGGIGLYKELPMGLSIYAEGKLTRRQYDGDFFGLNEPQKDTKIDFVASFTKRDFDIFGLAPRFDYIYSKSMSNSVFSEYSTHGANITLTKAF